jgi:hypothetical protein
VGYSIGISSATAAMYGIQIHSVIHAATSAPETASGVSSRP